MTAQEWRRVGNISGPANLFLDRYRIAAEAGRWVITDTDNGERLYEKHRTMRAARLFCEANRDQLAGPVHR